MKAALLPGYEGMGLLQGAATASGAWLRSFQRMTARSPQPLDADRLQRELATVCNNCKGEGLDDASIAKILAGTGAILERARNPLTNASVLHEFMPLNIVVLEHGVGFSDFARMEEDGSVYTDPATFLASVEALEKYPFCDHAITTAVQENFLDAYGASDAEREILCVFKMKVLLSMFAAGRTVKESPLRKKSHVGQRHEKIHPHGRRPLHARRRLGTPLEKTGAPGSAPRRWALTWDSNQPGEPAAAYFVSAFCSPPAPPTSLPSYRILVFVQNRR
jgi:hypothetical protein